MARTVAIGIQSFEKIRKENCFYIDKTDFIKEWWESKDEVTLITRPRRFGKTLTISMLEHFFSIEYAGRGDLFEELSIWQEEKYRNLQGTWPVISLSFARVKENNYASAREKICEILRNLYIKFSFLKDSQMLTDSDKAFYNRILAVDIRDSDATSALYQLSSFLYRHYGKKVIILLDEYDTPMQEAYVSGFWDELVSFIRNLFNSAFKTNPYLGRGMMTGITRISKESIFSDLNHLEVVAATSDKYATAFGFKEEEVFAALNEYDLGEKKEEVKRWYDGFIFGRHKDIYNPWSILHFLDKKEIDTYWANTSSNALVSQLLQQSSRQVKSFFESLLKGESITCSVDEQIIYSNLDADESAIFSLLVASGYLKILEKEDLSVLPVNRRPRYTLALTNQEVRVMFFSLVQDWFGKTRSDYNDFIQALLAGNIKDMNAYMKTVAMATFSYFDTGKQPSFNAPERFYHGFVLGLLAELYDQYQVTSNRESGYGRYDVIIEPIDRTKDAFILEFKVKDSDEKSLEDTVWKALAQIEEKQYAANLLTRGFKEEQIKKYAFAFEGKKVLIG